MSIPYYLYSAGITILCVLFLAGYIACYTPKRELKWLLMIILFFLFLISEISRIIFYLLPPIKQDLAFLLTLLWNACVLILYCIIFWEQTGKPLQKTGIILISLLTSVCVFLSHRIAFFITLLWLRPLYKFRKSDKRTFGMLFALIILNIYHAIYSLGLTFSLYKAMPVLAPGTTLNLILNDMMLYIILAFSAIDIIFQLHSRQKGIAAVSSEGVVTSSSDIQSMLLQLSTERGLSPRETDVFLLLVKGASAAEIAQELYISSNTVKVHVHNIYQKLNISSRRQINQLLMDYTGISSSSER